MTQQTAVDLLLSKIPNAREIKAFINDNDADEKMLDEWLWERIYKGVDYKQMEKEQIINSQMDMFHHINNMPYGLDYLNKRDSAEIFAKQYYNETYGGQGCLDTTK